MGPVVVGRARRNVKRRSCFIEGHADEVTELHQFGFARMLSGESIERVVDRKHLVVIRLGGKIRLVEFHALLAAAVPHSLLAPGAFDEDAAHGFGGRGEEMSAVLKARRVVAGQAQPGFVDQRSGLQRVTGGFIGHAGSRQFAQLVIDQRQQLVSGLGVAAINCLKYLGDLAYD